MPIDASPLGEERDAVREAAPELAEAEIEPYAAAGDAGGDAMSLGDGRTHDVRHLRTEGNPPASLDPAEAVARVARAVSGRLPEIADGMRVSLGDAISELVGDPRLLTLLGSAIEGNVTTVLAMLREQTSLHDVEVPAAAVAHARRLAEQGVPVFAMVRAYRLGQAYLLEECYRELVENCPDPALSLAAYNSINSAVMAYIDWVSQEVVTEYETERDQWVRNQDAVRAARVHEILAGRAGPDTREAEAALRYRLRQYHIAAVLWSEEDTSVDSLSRLESAVDTLSRELSTCEPLTVATDRSTAWAWFPRGQHDTEPDIDRLERLLRAAEIGDVRVALGGAGVGIDGFRESHRQSLEAQQVLRVGVHPVRRAIAYREAGVPAAAMLADDADGTTTLIHGALGPLAADDPANERLRETLLGFLECGSNYTAAAARLNLHKNSVKYRVERALELRGRPMSDDRIDVALALIACRWLRSPRTHTP